MRLRDALSLVVLALAGWGCSNRADDCKLNGDCGGAHPASTSSSAGGGATGGGGAASSSTGLPADCSGDPGDKNIDESCAVFVRSGATGHAGTRAAPLGDLAEAIELADESGKRVYACGDFDGPLLPTKAFDLWGGFACAGGAWTWSGIDRSSLGAPAGRAALVADVGVVVSVHAFSITGGAASMAGGSSIAVVFGKQVDPTLDRCDVHAPDGVPGEVAPGTPLPGAATVSPTGGSSNCSSSSIIHGGQLTCSDGSALHGGNGGDGGGGINKNGKRGTDGKIDSISKTTGGAGAFVNGPGCVEGQDGSDGVRGADGPGAVANETSFDVVVDPQGIPTGAVAVGGGAGNPGGPGQPGEPGAGGGGGAHTMMCRGGIGGGGMSGSCGGEGGMPGRWGGSSIGILCLGTRLTLLHVDIVVANGAAGGDGGAGALGGDNTTPAGATNPMSSGGSIGCSGGTGGKGGQGGTGGGGRGGHALAVAFTGAPSMIAVGDTSGWLVGAPGAGGVTPAPMKAEAGFAATCWSFANQAACP